MNENICAIVCALAIPIIPTFVLILVDFIGKRN